jgi:hypothetical protein
MESGGSGANGADRGERDAAAEAAERDTATEAAGLGIGGEYGGPAPGGAVGRADRSVYGEPMSAPPDITMDWEKAAPGLVGAGLSAVTGNPIGVAMGLGRAAFSGLGTTAGQPMGPGQGLYGGFYGGQPAPATPEGPTPGATDPWGAAAYDAALTRLHRSLYENPDVERFHRPLPSDSYARWVFGSNPPRQS